MLLIGNGYCMAGIKNMPKHLQPREKLIERGAENLRDSELMAILIRTGTKNKNVLQVSREILQKFPVDRLLELEFDELSKIKGIGPSKATMLLASFELTKRALEDFDDNLPFIKSEEDVMAQVQNIKNAKREHFVALYLNARNQLIYKEIISIGTLNASLVHPREVFYPAVKNFAASVIAVHNHPSGDATPSQDDIDLTKRLSEAGELLGIALLYHVVITKDSYKRIYIKYDKKETK